MWYAAKITTAPTGEPVSRDEAKRQCGVDFADDDAMLDGLIAAARDHVEAYCNLRLCTQTVEILCDGFTDFSRLPEGPVRSIASIAYTDPAGDARTLAPETYELRVNGLEAAIVPAFGQTWPATRPGSRITVTAVVGYETVPPAIKVALLLKVAESYLQREDAKAEDWTAVDRLLCNYRRGA